jgi:hypothetical protein
MPPSGQELIESCISRCQEISAGLEQQNSDWQKSIVEIIGKFDEISSTFFFKTMPSVPTTRKVLREAESLSDLKNSDNWSAFAPALQTFIASSQDLIEKAGMKGVTLT